MAENDKKKLEEILKKLISIKSKTGEENKIIDFLEDYLTDIGLEVERERIDHRENIFAYRGKPKYLIATHVDTVPAWGFRKAFSPKTLKGKVYGRGAVDTKGQISPLLLALEKTEESCAIAFFVDEEKDAKGSEKFNPKFKFDGALILEPTNFKISTMQAGSIEIYLEVRGTSSHGALPRKGRSAIDNFIEIYRKLKCLDHIKNRPKFFRDSGVNLGWIRGGVDCQIVPKVCRGEIDIPIFPDDDMEKIKREIEDIVKGYDAKMEIKTFDKPFKISKSEKVVKLLEKSIRGIKRVEYSGMPAWTDAANLIEKSIPSVVFGAGDLSLAHTERENIRIKDMVDLYMISKRFIELSEKY